MTEHAAAGSFAGSALRRLAWSDWVCVTLLLLLVVVMRHNVTAFSYISGYDAEQHVEYARSLIEDWDLPAATGAFYTPPVFYLVAGALTELFEALGSEIPERAGQWLSSASTLATGVLLLALVRLLFPARRLLHVAAMGFFVASPTVIKSAAMFHPQPLAMALSTLALVLTAHMLVRDRFPWWEIAALAVVLGLAQLVRSASLFTVGVVAVVLTIALIRRLHGRRLAVTLAAVLAAIVAIPLPWYLHLQRSYADPVFGRSGLPILKYQSLGFYVNPGLPDVLTHPNREALPRAFVPVLYADTWGDSYGAWTWAPPREFSTAVDRRLAVQSFTAVLPTVVGVAGWLGLLALAMWRWRTRPELLLVALLPVAALLGMLYYAARTPSADLDTVKGIFALTAIPAWAICFGFAVDVLWSRSSRVGIALAAVLAACGLVCLEFGWL